MSILLAIPPHIGPRLPHIEVNMGLAALTSVLRSKGMEVKMANFSDYSLDEMIQVIREEKPRILGMRCLTLESFGVIRFIEVIKKIDPSIKTVLGGAHATVMHRQILRHNPSVDYIVIGEGEESFVELVNTIYGNGDPHLVRGIAFREGEEIVVTPKRPCITDLDSLPFPEFDFDISKKKGIPMEEIFINTCRGCPMRCTFCTANAVWGPRYRTMSVKRIVDAIEYYTGKYGTRRIYFCDDTINASRERIISLCREILDRKLDIRWSSTARVDHIDQEIIRWMKESGCVRLEFGVESGSPVLREKMKKHITNKQIINAFDLANKAGIETLAFILWGYPGESLKTVIQTLLLLKRIKPASLFMSICSLLPGAELTEIQKAKGKFSDDFWMNPETPQALVTGPVKVFLLYRLNEFLAKHFRKRGVEVRSFRLDKRVVKNGPGQPGPVDGPPADMV